jgi:hypothetical protein
VTFPERLPPTVVLMGEARPAWGLTVLTLAVLAADMVFVALNASVTVSHGTNTACTACSWNRPRARSAAPPACTMCHRRLWTDVDRRAQPGYVAAPASLLALATSR